MFLRTNLRSSLCVMAILHCVNFVFFFQAEDGIRDVAVTGVQCALPICGVIYCENCLAQRLQDVMPPPGAPAPGVMPGGPGPMMVVPSSGPNPALAAVLAAFFPFGVG